MIREAKADEKVLALKALESVQKVSDGQATKLFIPSDLSGLGGVFASLKEIMGKDTPAGS
jgi:hypothetical protein